jgi:hypothetical protein
MLNSLKLKVGKTCKIGFTTPICSYMGAAIFLESHANHSNSQNVTRYIKSHAISSILVGIKTIGSMNNQCERSSPYMGPRFGLYSMKI